MTLPGRGLGWQTTDKLPSRLLPRRRPPSPPVTIMGCASETTSLVLLGESETRSVQALQEGPSSRSSRILRTLPRERPPPSSEGRTAAHAQTKQCPPHVQPATLQLLLRGHCNRHWGRGDRCVWGGRGERGEAERGEAERGQPFLRGSSEGLPQQKGGHEQHPLSLPTAPGAVWKAGPDSPRRLPTRSLARPSPSLPAAVHRRSPPLPPRRRRYGSRLFRPFYQPEKVKAADADIKTNGGNGAGGQKRH